ncbi:alpha-hydroxy-acid oxidizing protein, partial [Tsukamurella tyrosinosolvens]|uniref:alpha-hydroxy-acid oxidizing protein n=1 Tax=Tsukamurella tyrosinosolvens TaxID=57704 RepID=UPI000E150D17
AAVGAEATVLVDGDVRDGLDVLAALALGADAVFVGRPVLWGLAVSGADGVRSVLTGLLDELRHGMGLAGATRVAELSPDLVVPR